jgi:hypothetical protein
VGEQHGGRRSKNGNKKSSGADEDFMLPIEAVK